uniref:Uncharacterized protein n=1 Tax=Schlesneria paludicola TaxID=360056 RepID=A0A7C4LJU6_9PLAN
MNRRPTVKQLSALIATADDNAGAHVMWVGRNGEVHLTTLHDGYPPDLWAEQMTDRMMFHLVFQRSAGFVGSSASSDWEWLRDLLEFLRQRWSAKAVGCLMG